MEIEDHAFKFYAGMLQLQSCQLKSFMRCRLILHAIIIGFAVLPTMADMLSL